MTLLPYPSIIIPYTIVHSADIALLLAFGFVYELAIRLYRHKNENRTSRERKVNIHLATLRYEAAKKRALGPSAFVETSKLERAVLATEKELEKLKSEREARSARTATLIKKCNLVTNIVVMLMYYGVAMLAIDGSRIIDENIASNDHIISDVERATSFWKGLFFPLTYHGMGYKIAQYGIESSMRASCVGALAVFWAARTTSGEVFECAIKWLSR
ncbi:hypothetical protein ACHAWT_000574 [Skeletonema menzelii]|mmetsp:Transcript_19676/g.32270  ORF Transcript_19676/g.32270 Transcript_19676/m.32270 type:complete len:216 (+) Transcript_19676:83-730(+)